MTTTEELDDWSRDHCETCGESKEDCADMRND